MMRTYTIGCCMILLAMQAQAQKGVNSLYSAYGIGDLEEKDYSRNFGTGSAGIARPSGNYLNELNPASYGRIPMETFFFEASVAAKSIQYNSSEISQSAGDISFKRFAMGFKVNPRWGVSLGLMPYSRVDFKLVNNTSIAGTGAEIQNAIEGTGGINRLYFSNGVKLTKNFYAGLSSALLFGPVTITDSLGNNEIHTEKKYFYRSFNFTAGLQYTGRAGAWEVGAGATYRWQTRLQSEDEFSIRDADDNMLYEGQDHTGSYYLPAQYGLGLMMGKERISLMADYRLQQWDGLNGKNTDFKYVNSQRFAGGMEYSFYKYYFDKRVEHLSIQAGLSYHTGYIQVKGEKINDFGLSVGASLPSRTGHLRYYLGLEGGQRGTSSNGLITETYFNVVLHLGLKDNWFFKRKEL
ncbi:hypothetical protein [Chitinophaga barathri]|uniref:Uncharacterized protein n=1 Tax=Chitinophaga barathri TaxID=1647451 RepID=A0A3N4MAV9_9BACT|nr:hypothetical protein [Chitinophaga barathri]RPD40922.1 hypothetical protein EG028_12975 [Chitinophaga barathri]